MDIYKNTKIRVRELPFPVIREIIAIIIILCISIALSYPQYIEDREKAEAQKLEIRNND